MMGKQIIRNVSTKMTEDHDAVITTLTLDFNTLAVDEVYEIAAQAAVVKWQGNARRGKVIPGTATYVVPRAGSRGSLVIDYEQALTKVFGFEKVQLLKTKFGTAELAYNRLKPQLDLLMEELETEG